MPFSLQIEGLADLRRALRSAAAEAPRLVSPCLTRALVPMAGRVRGEAPEDTGRLAASVEVIEHAPRNGRCASEVKITAPYSAHVDLGTKGHPPEHFAEHAFDATARRAADEATRDIIDAIEKVLHR